MASWKQLYFVVIVKGIMNLSYAECVEMSNQKICQRHWRWMTSPLLMQKSFTRPCHGLQAQCWTPWSTSTPTVFVLVELLMDIFQKSSNIQVGELSYIVKIIRYNLSRSFSWICPRSWTLNWMTSEWGFLPANYKKQCNLFSIFRVIIHKVSNEKAQQCLRANVLVSHFVAFSMAMFGKLPDRHRW